MLISGMPYTIGRTSEGILRIRAFGVGHVDEARELTEALREWLKGEVAPRLLIDTRELEFVPTVEEGRAMAVWFGAVCIEYRAPLAVLTPPGVEFGMARMVSTLAELRGATAGAFLDETEALRWLRGVTPTSQAG